MPRKHPMQPVALDDNGTPRFVQNKIVRFLLDAYEPGLNDINFRTFGKDEFDADDYEQLMMLIGYSTSGFGDIDTMSGGAVRKADRAAAKLLAACNLPGKG